MNTLSAPVALAPLHPGLVTARFFETWDFYTTHLGFRTVCECDTYVQLAHPSGAQLGVLREETDGHPAELVSATTGRGFWLKLEVADVGGAYAKMKNDGVDVASVPEDMPWGERCFTVRDPNGILIYLGQRRAAA